VQPHTQPLEPLVVSGREADDSQLARARHNRPAKGSDAKEPTGVRKNSFTGARLKVQRAPDHRFATGKKPFTIAATRLRAGQSAKLNESLLYDQGLISSKTLAKDEASAYPERCLNHIPHCLVTDRNFEHRVMANAEIGAAIVDFLKTDNCLFATQIMTVASDNPECISVTADDTISALVGQLDTLFSRHTIYLSGFAELAFWAVGADGDYTKPTNRNRLATHFASNVANLGSRGKKMRKRSARTLRKRIADFEKRRETMKTGGENPEAILSNYHLHYVILVIDENGRILSPDEVRGKLTKIRHGVHDLQLQEIYKPPANFSASEQAWWRFRHVRNVGEYAVKRHDESKQNRLLRLLFHGCSAHQGVFNIVLKGRRAARNLPSLVTELLDVRRELLLVAKLPVPASGLLETSSGIRRRLDATDRPLLACPKTGKVAPVSTKTNTQEILITKWIQMPVIRSMFAVIFGPRIERERDP
jgi:hypothetical protein